VYPTRKKKGEKLTDWERPSLSEKKKGEFSAVTPQQKTRTREDRRGGGRENFLFFTQKKIRVRTMIQSHFSLWWEGGGKKKK